MVDTIDSMLTYDSSGYLKEGFSRLHVISLKNIIIFCNDNT